jgi:hypothetical protein
VGKKGFFHQGVSVRAYVYVCMYVYMYVCVLSRREFYLTDVNVTKGLWSRKQCILERCESKAAL